jgi:hypothetical protein
VTRDLLMQLRKLSQAFGQCRPEGLWTKLAIRAIETWQERFKMLDSFLWHCIDESTYCCRTIRCDYCTFPGPRVYLLVEQRSRSRPLFPG